MSEKSARQQVLSLAETLDIFELAGLISDLQGAFESRRAAEAEVLMERLRALGMDPGATPANSPPAKGKRKSGAPKYRSRKDPALTWAGRGNVAKWLKDEMAESGLPMTAFEMTGR